MTEETFEKVTNWAEEFKGINNELEERILEANHDDTKVKWNKLLSDLMGAEVFIAGQYSGQPVDDSGRKEVSVMMIQKDGHTIVPFFTSPERLAVLVDPKNSQFDVLKLNTVRLFESIVGKHTMLNPMSPYARLFTPFEMRILAAENADKAPALPEKEDKGEDQ